MRLGAGNSSLWYEDWTGKGLLATLVTFVHISDTNMRLRDLWNHGSWNLNALSTIIPMQVRDAILQVNVPSIANDNIEDSWVWKGTHEGCYSAASGYAWLLNRHRSWDTNQEWNWVWRLRVLAKVQNLVWQVLHQALPTAELRNKRGIAPSSACPLHTLKALYIASMTVPTRERLGSELDSLAIMLL